MEARDVVDGALEISVVGSFTSIGYRFRRRLYGWTDPPPDALRGRTVLVTGPTSGLGRATAEACARLGARVILVGRSEERLADVRTALVAELGEDRFPLQVADMASIDAVRAMVTRIIDDEPRLDVLIDSAGAILDERTETVEGIEATFATMVVGPFVMLAGLLPLLAAAPDGRAISVVSGGMYAQALPLDDLGFEAGYDGTLAYARAKRAQTMIVREWARRLGPHGPRVNTMHPGWADTPGLADALPAFHGLMGPLLRTADEGIDTLLWLASDAAAGHRGGQLFLDRRPRPFDRVPATRLDAAERRRLWERVAAMAGVADPLAGLTAATAEVPA